MSFLSHRFGGKKPFLKTVWHAVGTVGGRYARYRRIDWSKVQRLVFVCKGNICRSAYGDARTRILGHPAASAGLAADPGTPADPRASATARQRGIDLSPHRARTIPGLGVQPGDLLIAFEPEHAERLAQLCGATPDVQITLIGLWHPQRLWAYVQDPYGLSEAYFGNCFNRIEAGLDGLLARWKAH